MKYPNCPRCKSPAVEVRHSFGGPAVYGHLVCLDCGLHGGRVRVYEGEDSRVERELVERFCVDNKRDAVTEFVDGIVGVEKR